MVRVAGDVDPVLPPSVLKNIGDKLYEKRKQAALEVEQIVKQKSSQGNQEKVSVIIEKLVQDYAKSTSANHRKGGLLCLAAIAVGLGAEDNDRFLESIVPPVLESFRDPDGGVRYYGLEALYNVAKVSRESFLRYFSDTFDSLFRLCADAETRVQNAAMILDNMIKDIVAACDHFDIERFIPRLAQFLAVPHVPHKRRFLIDWTSLLQSVPDIDMLLYLPHLLDGMMTMLSDTHTEIRTAAGRTLDNFLRQIEKAPESTDFAALTRVLVAKAKSSDDATRYTAMRWLNCFLTHALAGSHDSMMSFLADLIIAVLPCISHANKDIRDAAVSCNNKLLALDLSKHLATVGIGPVLTALSYELTSQQQPTRLEALRWVQVLLEHNKADMLQQWHDIMPALLDALTSSSDGVVKQALLVHVKIAQEEVHFKSVLRALLERFQGDSGPLLLQKRGTLIIRGLCGLLGGIKVFTELASILEGEASSAFASSITQALNVLLLTAPELSGLRAQLQNAQEDAEAAALLAALYPCWCHSACAALSLCMLAQAYAHIDAMIHVLAELPLLPVLLAQIDRFVMLVDSPVFTRARLQLLAPQRYPGLMRAMYSLLMLCPQSTSFQTLQARLSSVPTLALLKLNDAGDATDDATAQRGAGGDEGKADDGGSDGAAAVQLPWAEMLQTFRAKQERLVQHHEEHEKLPWTTLPNTGPATALNWDGADSSAFNGVPAGGQANGSSAAPARRTSPAPT